MVTYERNSIKNSRDKKEIPPPIDEGWWEAVLAEEEAEAYASANGGAKNQSTSPKNHSAGHLNPRPADEANLSNPEAQTGEASELNWQKALELYESDQVVTLDVTGYNRGGLLVEGENIQGFVPISHLVETPCTDPESDEWLAKYLERPLMLKVIECDPERGRIVFSERAALSEPGTRIHLLNHLQPGDCVRGSVTNITDFGVFVDLGGVEGLIHVSEISWGRVHHPSDVVGLGEFVDVYVIHVDRERARVALSLKRLHPNPWETAHSRYFPGQITEAVVTSIVPFGVFARLEEGLDGLIHISEMTHANQASGAAGSASAPISAAHLKEGQQIQVRVLHVDCARQRLGLSLRLSD